MTEQEAKALVEWFKERKGKTLKLNDNGIDCVVEALEKQIAKKVYDDSTYCPSCDANAWIECEPISYCPRCGQKIDWGNEDD